MSVSTGSVILVVASAATQGILGFLTRQTFPPCPGCPACPTCPSCPGAAATPATPATPGLSVDSGVGWWSYVLIVIVGVVWWLARGSLPAFPKVVSSYTPRIDVVTVTHGGGGDLASVGSRRVVISPLQRRRPTPATPTLAIGDGGVYGACSSGGEGSDGLGYVPDLSHSFARSCRVCLRVQCRQSRFGFLQSLHRAAPSSSRNWGTSHV